MFERPAYRLIVRFVFALSAPGCAAHGASAAAPCPEPSAKDAPNAPATDTPATERAPAPRDTAAFNAWLGRHQHARDLPLLIAHAFAGADARAITFSVSYASGESAVRATATVTLDGLLDDSVRGEEHVLTFARDAVGAPWRLEQATSRVRCWQGRGHAEFSTVPCS